MKLEEKLVNFVHESRFEDMPAAQILLMKQVLINALGAIIAGAETPGCPEAVAQAREWGGKEEATILVYGDRVSAGNAAFANAFIARALVLDEAMVGGLHVGGSAVPAALATAELVGGCNGRDLLTALAVGFELACRMHLATVYNGFDATGVCVVFGATAVAGRLLSLTRDQLWNALGHALNRAGGSWQGTIDGSIAARVLQGTAAQGGIANAQLAKRGITGPVNFLEGIYGYFHLFAGDKYDSEMVGGELGTRFDLSKIFLKKYPSCGTTNASIDAIFSLMEEEGVTPDNVAEINVRVTPFTFNLTGKPFSYGDNPRVSAMYSIQYCVANTLVRKKCRLRHFDETRVKAYELIELINKIHVFANPSWDETKQLVSDMEVRLTDGTVHQRYVEFPKGTAENPLTSDDLLEKFMDCLSYGGNKLSPAKSDQLIALVDRLEVVEDIQDLIPFLTDQG
jgi:2-methylcitrate dehydratase PrpD